MVDEDVKTPVEGAEDDTTLVDRGDELTSPLDTAGKGDETDDTAKGDKLDEGEETPEEKAERERLEAEEAKKRNIRIPKSRFDEAQAKARQREQALLEEIERLKSGQNASSVQKTISDMRSKIEELQDKYEDMILDGKKEDARKVRKQVESMREELIEYQTSVKSDAARKAAIDELTYNAQLASFEAKYPVLNPDHEDFDEDRTNEVASLLNALVRAGLNRADALSKAIKYVLGNPPEQKVADAAKALAEERARKAREKTAEVSKKQPPSMSKVGLDSDKAGKAGEMGVDIMRLSQEKFANLDEETKAKLRGDEL